MRAINGMGALSTIVSDLWTYDACGVNVRLVDDQVADRWVIVVDDGTPDGNYTFRQLDLGELLRWGDPNKMMAYLDGEISRTIEAHRQPYNQWPKTTAADEMAYCLGV